MDHLLLQYTSFWSQVLEDFSVILSSGILRNSWLIKMAKLLNDTHQQPLLFKLRYVKLSNSMKSLASSFYGGNQLLTS